LAFIRHNNRIVKGKFMQDFDTGKFDFERDWYLKYKTGFVTLPGSFFFDKVSRSFTPSRSYLFSSPNP
jgi:hypothetical protein